MQADLASARPVASSLCFPRQLSQNSVFLPKTMDSWLISSLFQKFSDYEYVLLFFFLDDLWWRWFVDALASLPSESSYNVFVPWLLDEAIAMPIPWFTSHCGFLKSQRAARWLSPKNIWSVGIIIPFSIHFWEKKKLIGGFNRTPLKNDWVRQIGSSSQLGRGFNVPSHVPKHQPVS